MFLNHFFTLALFDVYLKDKTPKIKSQPIQWNVIRNEVLVKTLTINETSIQNILKLSFRVDVLLEVSPHIEKRNLHNMCGLRSQRIILTERS